MKGWRTVIFNIVVLILPILEMSEWRDIIPSDYMPYYIISVTVINLVLRTITTTPVGKTNVS